LDASQNIKALMINVKRPSVIIVMGKDKMRKTGRMSALTKPMTTAAKKACGKSLIKTPGTRYATSMTVKALRKRRRSKYIGY